MRDSWLVELLQKWNKWIQWSDSRERMNYKVERWYDWRLEKKSHPSSPDKSSSLSTLLLYYLGWNHCSCNNFSLFSFGCSQSVFDMLRKWLFQELIPEMPSELTVALWLWGLGTTWFENSRIRRKADLSALLVFPLLLLHLACCALYITGLRWSTEVFSRNCSRGSRVAEGALWTGGPCTGSSLEHFPPVSQWLRRVSRP